MKTDTAPEVQAVIDNFTRKQDADMAVMRKALVVAGCSAEQLNQFDTITTGVRDKVIQNIPGYMESVKAMVQRDLLNEREH